MCTCQLNGPSNTDIPTPAENHPRGNAIVKRSRPIGVLRGLSLRARGKGRHRFSQRRVLVSPTCVRPRLHFIMHAHSRNTSDASVFNRLDKSTHGAKVILRDVQLVGPMIYFPRLVQIYFAPVSRCPSSLDHPYWFLPMATHDPDPKGLTQSQRAVRRNGDPLQSRLIVYSPRSRFDAPMPRDPFVREKLRTAGRRLAAEYFERFPKQRYQTEVESWRELQSQNIGVHHEAAARADRRRRLNKKESASVGGLYFLRFLLTLLMIGHIPILARHLR
jgi:hypothetical protein